MSSIQQVIAGVADQVAQQYGFNAQQTAELQAISLATAQQESGFNPAAIGDQGTSFGLFQLHQGGELGNLTPSQAENPQTNAQVAIPVIAQTLKANPGWSPGRIAAAAQRPADQAAYATDINNLYPQYSGGQVPTGSGSGSGSGGGGGGGSTPGITIGNAGPFAITLPVGADQTLTGIGANIGAVVFGAILIVVGVIVAVRPHLPQTAPVPVPVPV